MFTCVAPVNIAVIKYWGKRDEDLILPLNDSISSTLSLDLMWTKTTVMASPTFKENKIWLNGKEEDFNQSRLLNCLKELKKRAQNEVSEITKWYVHICSENNFPTAAGLASSAAGYACLVYSLSKLYKIQGDISSLARQGSGSACRSVYGGWVRWHKGMLNDGTDSIASQIASSTHWPEIRILILVVDDSRKKYSSTNGMKFSTRTSELLKYRVSSVVPKRLDGMERAIKEKDFESFANITMQDSNQFHAVCLDTFPPCIYMNSTSHIIIDFVHTYNIEKGITKLAYTFDAGPNACLYMLEKDVPEIVALLYHVFPPQNDTVEYIKGIPVDKEILEKEIPCTIKIEKQPPGALKYMIHTKIGDGPKQLEDDLEHLLTNAGLPKRTC